MFESLSDKLKRTLKNLRGEGVLDEGARRGGLREIRLALLEADVNYKVAKDFIASVRKKPRVSRFGKSSNHLKSLRLFMTSWLIFWVDNRRGWSLPNRSPNTVMVVGLQVLVRLPPLKNCRWLAANQDRKPLLVSVDVYAGRTRTAESYRQSDWPTDL